MLLFLMGNNNFYYLPGQTLTLRFDPQREEDFAYSEFPAKVTGNNHFDAYPSQNDCGRYGTGPRA